LKNRLARASRRRPNAHVASTTQEGAQKRPVVVEEWVVFYHAATRGAARVACAYAAAQAVHAV